MRSSQARAPRPLKRGKIGGRADTHYRPSARAPQPHRSDPPFQGARPPPSGIAELPARNGTRTCFTQGCNGSARRIMSSLPPFRSGPTWANTLASPRASLSVSRPSDASAFCGRPHGSLRHSSRAPFVRARPKPRIRRLQAIKIVPAPGKGRKQVVIPVGAPLKRRFLPKVVLGPALRKFAFAPSAALDFGLSLRRQTVCLRLDLGLDAQLFGACAGLDKPRLGRFSPPLHGTCRASVSPSPS
jgi:hypothetical protein